MSAWTLRPQKHHGERRTSSAALRAQRYVWRHAWQFHGSGVADAVAQLEATDGVRQGVGSLSFREACAAHMLAAFDVPLMPAEPYGLCPDCRGPNLAPGLIHQCPVDRPSLTARCVCKHPYSTHNVNGLCVAFPGRLGCGCLGWSEDLS